MSTRYLILGLLTQHPLTGYDVKTSLEELKWLIDVPSYGSLYPALHTMLEEGLVSLTVVPQEGKPARKVYSITEPGTKALQTWLNQPVETATSQKAFVTRLLLAGNFSREGLRAYLMQRYQQMATHRTALTRELEVSPVEGNSVSDPLVIEYGIAIANAEILWLENVLARFSEDTQP